MRSIVISICFFLIVGGVVANYLPLIIGAGIVGISEILLEIGKDIVNAIKEKNK